MRGIVLFAGASSERRVSVASAQNVVGMIDGAVPWFSSPEGGVHAVGTGELAAHARPFETDFVPRGAAFAPNLRAALEGVTPSDVIWLALLGPEGWSISEALVAR